MMKPFSPLRAASFPDLGRRVDEQIMDFMHELV